MMHLISYFEKIGRGSSSRGFTLLVSIILTSVVLAISLALTDVAYKQVILASTAKQSVFALYGADSAVECALYWDQKKNAFSYSAPLTSIVCNGQTMTFATAPNSTTVDAGTGIRTTTLYLPCASGGTLAVMNIYKSSTGVTSIYGNGYNTCNAADPQRIERGLKVGYSGSAGGGGGGGGGGGVHSFALSPSVGGKSTWDLDVDGPLTFASSGTWTITPSFTLTASTKVWGAGGVYQDGGTGGGGGYAGGTVTFQSGVPYTIYVGSTGTAGSPGTGGSPGGGTPTGSYGSGGGGYSGIRKSDGTGILIAGGGGGGGYPGSGTNGGAGGGATGQAANTSGGGTQIAGGAGGYGGAGGSAYQGGGGARAGSGGGGYYGGGGGGSDEATFRTGGGGGSGYYDPSSVSGSVLTTGSLTTPGNSGDSDRGTAGNGGTSGIAGKPGLVKIGP